MLLIRNFQMNLKSSGTLAGDAKIKYLHMLVHGKVLYHIDTLSTEVGINTSEHLKSIILSLGTYFLLLIRWQNKSAQCAAE